MEHMTAVYCGEGLARYGFGEGHPFSRLRHDAFVDELYKRQLHERVILKDPVMANREEIERFHTHEYLGRVMAQSKSGDGFLDYGDTPAFVGVYEAAATVVGSVLDALEQLVAGDCSRAFVPIAGLHHARRDLAAGFCVFNDCGVAIETLRRQYHIQRVAYVDIDAHHGDGVFYAFEEDPDLIFADLHEDGHFLYPGTGGMEETGRGVAKGTKLNIPMPPDAGDALFMRMWERVEMFLERFRPEFFLLQCGADSLDGDPITHLRYSPAAHAHAAKSLCRMADEYAKGRILALGGGGYNLQNLARGWCGVVEAFVQSGSDG